MLQALTTRIILVWFQLCRLTFCNVCDTDLCLSLLHDISMCKLVLLLFLFSFPSVYAACCRHPRYCWHFLAPRSLHVSIPAIYLTVSAVLSIPIYYLHPVYLFYWIHWPSFLGCWDLSGFVQVLNSGFVYSLWFDPEINTSPQQHIYDIYSTVIPLLWLLQATSKLSPISSGTEAGLAQLKHTQSILKIFRLPEKFLVCCFLWQPGTVINIKTDFVALSSQESHSSTMVCSSPLLLYVIITQYSMSLIPSVVFPTYFYCSSLLVVPHRFVWTSVSILIVFAFEIIFHAYITENTLCNSLITIFCLHFYQWFLVYHQIPRFLISRSESQLCLLSLLTHNMLSKSSICLYSHTVGLT